ncbi:MAG TPA: hypothetical protein VGK20_07190 [Candidatus Binatia bacterium]
MADLADLSGTVPVALECDRAIFTSLPSNIGEGYRLVAWSGGLKLEERQELTRRAPSHGSLVGESGRATMLFHLQSSGRAAWGFVRVAGAEHTRRGGGRVWTDFLLADAGDARREGPAPALLRDALAASVLPKPPLGSSPLAKVGVARGQAPAPAKSARIESVARVASLLFEGRTCVVAAGGAPVEVFEQALRLLPACLRERVDACAGLRFSPARGVKTTLTDRIDQDTLRATRGQKVECVDLEKSAPALEGPLAPWWTLVLRWWNEGRGDEATSVADRLTGGWNLREILDVAALCESIDRREFKPDALAARLARHSVS